jgi:mannose-6-phosphate isomerase-like protein (cupin superfamily)
MQFPQKRSSYTISPKGWGEEVHIHNSEDYCGKLLNLSKGGKCSLHFHIDKTETFYIFKGRVKLSLFYDLKKEEISLRKGDAIDIPRFLAHSFYGEEDSVILEISTYDDPADSVRIAPGDSQRKQVPIDNNEFVEWEEKCRRINGKS